MVHWFVSLPFCTTGWPHIFSLFIQQWKFIQISLFLSIFMGFLLVPTLSVLLKNWPNFGRLPELITIFYHLFTQNWVLSKPCFWGLTVVEIGTVALAGLRSAWSSSSVFLWALKTLLLTIIPMLHIRTAFRHISIRLRIRTKSSRSSRKLLNPCWRLKLFPFQHISSL